MSVMSREIAHWALNTTCFQHNIRDRSIFISYTFFSKFVRMNDLDESTTTIEQKTVRIACKVDIKRIDIFFSNAFYVSKCSLNLISFDQLDNLCSMTYKSRMLFVENQDIIARKCANNVFFFELWKHVSYNFVITFIVDNFVEQVLVVALEFVDRRFSINKTTLNIWHTRLKHLKKQNVRRLTKMSESMNLSKFVVDKDSCVFCIIIKQKIELHSNFMISDKYFLNLMWSDLVEFSISNDKTRYFVTFLCDFIKRSVIYVLRVKSNTFEAFKHFQQHNEHENNRVRRLRIDWEEKYFSNEFDDYRFEHDIQWKLIVSRISKQNEVVERLKQTFMSMISIMLKNVDLNNKWWIELIKTINYLRNRFSMTNRSVILYEIDTRKKSFFAHLRQIETTSYVMKRKSITKWKKLAFRSFSVVLVNYERDHIYRMLRFNKIIYRVSSIIWIKKKIAVNLIMLESKRQVIEAIKFFAKRQIIESIQLKFSFIIVLMSM
jgi:hypothetical protein